MEFIEAPAFTKYVSEYLTDDGYRLLQGELSQNPDEGDLMPGTGGFRKLRWADSRRGKGRRGGLRIIYFHFASSQQIWMMTLYGKNEAADPTPSEKKALKAAIEAELDGRQETRLVRAKRRRRK